MSVYKIKPIEWHLGVGSKDSYYENTTNGGYHIKDAGSWAHVSYCFTEHYDEGGYRAKNLRAAKAWVKKDWEKRLSAFLDEVAK